MQKGANCILMQMVKNTRVDSLLRVRKNTEELEKIVNNSYFGKKMYQYIFENGLSIVMIPDKFAKETYFSWNVNCGSMNNSCLENSKTNNYYNGIAKFLEYEMFERKIDLKIKGTIKDRAEAVEKDALVELKECSKSQTNKTFTSFSFKTKDKLWYLIPYFLKLMQQKPSCYDNREAQRYLYRKVLLDNYGDYKILYNKTLKSMYDNRDIFVDEYGYTSQIEQFRERDLISYYENFYSPENSVLIAIGGFEPSKLVKFIKRYISIDNNDFAKTEKVVNSIVENHIRKGYIDCFLENLNDFYFTYGLKLAQKTENVFEEKILYEIILENYFGENSAFCKKNKKILEQSDFGVILEVHKEFSHIIFVGKSIFREKILGEIQKTISQIDKTLKQDDLRQAQLKVFSKINNGSFENLNENLIQNYFEFNKDILKWNLKDVNLVSYYKIKDLIINAERVVVTTKTSKGGTKDE